MGSILRNTALLNLNSATDPPGKSGRSAADLSPNRRHPFNDPPDAGTRAAKELLHIQAWLIRAGEIVERGREAYLGDDLLQEAGARS